MHPPPIRSCISCYDSNCYTFIQCLYSASPTAAIPFLSFLMQCNATQQQTGRYDCGLFSIALAYHKAVGDNIEKLSLDQSKLRTHLARCFERKSYQVCDGCEQWFHLKCARLRRAPIQNWYCTDCKK